MDGLEYDRNYSSQFGGKQPIFRCENCDQHPPRCPTSLRIRIPYDVDGDGNPHQLRCFWNPPWLISSHNQFIIWRFSFNKSTLVVGIINYTNWKKNHISHDPRYVSVDDFRFPFFFPRFKHDRLKALRCFTCKSAEKERNDEKFRTWKKPHGFFRVFPHLPTLGRCGV